MYVYSNQVLHIHAVYMKFIKRKSKSHTYIYTWMD